jgi:DNA polymerase
MKNDFGERREAIEKLTKEIKNCKKCSLWKTRRNAVIGEGPLNSNIMFIGEAPGYNEDLQGKPFVGKAGKVFDELLESVTLQRKEVYIANILKCRPPNNRDPLLNEIKNCKNYLDRQISIIQPKVIVPLGNFASFYIFEKYNLKKEKISKVHGKSFSVRTILDTKQRLSKIAGGNHVV